MKPTILLIIMILFSSCVLTGPSSNTSKFNNSSVKSNSTNSGQSDGSTPTLSAYLQADANQSTSSLILNTKYNDNFYLRGVQVNNFLSGEINRSSTQCLVIYFKSNVVSKKILLLAAIPKSFNNLKTKQSEYYYFMQSLDGTVNKANCQKTSLLNFLNQKYGNEQIAYTFKDVCQNCSASVQSSPLSLFTPNGNEITDLAIKHLTIQLGFIPDSNTNTLFCSQKSECVAQGYQCCLSGQCVMDGQLRQGVSSSTAGYNQASDDILSYPAHFKNYPQFFYVCPNEIMATPTPDNSQNTYDEALMRFREKENLYNCTSPDHDELTYCSVLYENASKSIIGTPTPFATLIDDRNFESIYSGTYTYSTITSFSGFSGNKIPRQSVVEVSYGDHIIYSLDKLVWDSSLSFLNSNDDLFSTAQSVKINNYQLPSTAGNENLIIKYKTDGSCVPVNDSLIKCKKYYYQGQNKGMPSDHYPSSQMFEIPSYADLTKKVSVSVNEFSLFQGNEWDVVTSGSKKYAKFTNNYLIYDTYKVEIVYYVSLTSYPHIFDSKKAALSKIDKMCDCGNLGCTLKPIYKSIDGTETITDYICVYPTPNLPEPPSQQTVFVPSKSAPHRYYDENGGSVDEFDATSNPQEGTKFEYTQNNLLKPNNISSNIGFNEIYGSYLISPLSAKPPKMVKVKIGKVYHIFVNKAYFSTCLLCGSDYYSQIFKLFPSTSELGGGYIPDPVKSSKTNESEISYTEDFRADDLIFGRACWVPASMIPWTHSTGVDVRTQRLNRLKAQHTLFANGYQRDWYGFDYGALIGSFDGVTWFAIGSNRTIKATTNKLFLAINSYFSDLTTNDDYSVTISEGAGGAYAGSVVDSDYKSDGAQCQQYHKCSTDSDCVTQLGWEYTCQDVSDINTYWPTFNNNADEVIKANSKTRLIEIIGGLGGGPTKRCVYRGRGAPCVPYVSSENNYSTATGNNSSNSYVYSQVTNSQPGLHACLSNFYCQPFTVNNSLVSKFNTKISRFAKSPLAQNTSNDVDDSLNTHIFGYGARNIGRPFDYNGTKALDSTIVSQLSKNYVGAICIPGKNPATTNFLAQSSATPDSNYAGDQVLNIGHTLKGPTKKDYFYSSCGIFDTENNFLSLSKPDTVFSTSAAGDNNINILAATQALSTNTLKKFNINGSENNESDGSKDYKAILADFKGTDIIDSPMLQENTCLRAPGSVCHTDWDCGPNNFISSFVNKLTYDELSDTLNEAEYNFWKEDLVCGQKEFPYTKDKKINPKYDLKLNRCCREIGKNFSIYTQYSETPQASSSPNYLASSIAGKDIALNNRLGYSRNSTNYYNISVDTEIAKGYAPLKISNLNQCASGSCATSDVASHPLSQFLSLDNIAKNTCCTQNWVRNFHKENGGGHKFEPTKMQSFNSISDFACLNIYRNKSGCGDSSTTCEEQCDTDTMTDCAFIGLDNTDEKRIGSFFNSLELIGIPQVLIKSKDFSTPGPERITCDFKCSSHPTKEGTICTSSLGAPVPNTISPTATPEFIKSTTNQKYLSAIDLNNFAPEIRFIFSENEFSCCLPTGEIYDERVTDEMCCTGQKDEQTNRCCLPDFANISVYLNRYVSSEANKLDSSLFDEETGALKDISYAIQLATNKNICCSGSFAIGTLINTQKIPRAIKNKTKSKRAIYDGDDDSTEFKKGRRWNTDIYCVPKGSSSSGGSSAPSSGGSTGSGGSTSGTGT